MSILIFYFNTYNFATQHINNKIDNMLCVGVLNWAKRLFILCVCMCVVCLGGGERRSWVDFWYHFCITPESGLQSVHTTYTVAFFLSHQKRPFVSFPKRRGNYATFFPFLFLAADGHNALRPLILSFLVLSSLFFFLLYNAFFFLFRLLL